MQKLQHDIVGHYQRFDVLSLNLNRRPLKPIWEMGAGEEREGFWKKDAEEMKILLAGLVERIQGK
ncbi:MAG: hypothetical protein H6Q44_2386 [Deltaproteobacteria bacterium]|nr:hypothetical protein [Deltaproteobacteria bacterium]